MFSSKPPASSTKDTAHCFKQAQTAMATKNFALALGYLPKTNATTDDFSLKIEHLRLKCLIALKRWDQAKEIVAIISSPEKIKTYTRIDNIYNLNMLANYYLCIFSSTMAKKEKTGDYGPYEIDYLQKANAFMQQIPMDFKSKSILKVRNKIKYANTLYFKNTGQIDKYLTASSDLFYTNTTLLPDAMIKVGNSLFIHYCLQEKYKEAKIFLYDLLCYLQQNNIQSIPGGIYYHVIKLAVAFEKILEQPDIACEIYKTCIDTFPNQVCSIHNNYAVLLQTQYGEYNQSITILTRLIDLVENKKTAVMGKEALSSTYLSLSIAYQNTIPANLKEAARCRIKAEQLDPSRPAILSMAAKSCHPESKYQLYEAARELDRGRFEKNHLTPDEEWKKIQSARLGIDYQPAASQASSLVRAEAATAKANIPGLDAMQLQKNKCKKNKKKKAALLNQAKGNKSSAKTAFIIEEPAIEPATIADQSPCVDQKAQIALATTTDRLKGEIENGLMADEYMPKGTVSQCRRLGLFAASVAVSCAIASCVTLFKNY
jgi:hypothetical protein